MKYLVYKISKTHKSWKKQIQTTDEFNEKMNKNMWLDSSNLLFPIIQWRDKTCKERNYISLYQKMSLVIKEWEL